MLFKVFIIIFINQLVIFSLQGKESCQIFINDHLIETDYFQDLPFYVKWDSSQEIEDAAPELALNLLEAIEGCKTNTVILRPHGHASNIIYYALGLGRRYQTRFPEHDFVKLYYKVTAVISFMPIFHGTPLMDEICAGNYESNANEILGEECVVSMSTTKLFHPQTYVAGTGIPFYIISSIQSNGLPDNSNKFLTNYGLQYNEIFQGKQNLHDGVVPLHSQKGCLDESKILLNNNPCQKINSESLFDLKTTSIFTHINFIDDDEFLFQNY